MKRSIDETIKIYVCVSSLLLFIVGSIMIWSGVKAEGIIDIKSTLLSGSVKSGSAGIILVFIAFILLLIVLLVGNKKTSNVGLKKSAIHRLGVAITWIFFALLISVGLATNFPAFGSLAFFLGFALIPTGIAYLVFLDKDK